MNTYADKMRTDVDMHAPMETLHHAHDRIVVSLQGLSQVPALIEQLELARCHAAQAVELFDGPVLRHHADEERVLFPAVLASAQPGPEADRARAFTDFLTAQHRALEAQWRALEKPLRALARGKLVEVAPKDIARLVADYATHAQMEERQYLPFAAQVLGRDPRHLEAFGLSLHLEHLGPVTAHI